MVIVTATPIKPGVYREMPDDEYRALPALSNSDLMAWGMKRDIDPRNAVTGTAFHLHVLERPEVVEDTVLVCEHRRNSNAWAEFNKQHSGKLILTSGEKKKIDGMLVSISGGEVGDTVVEPHPQLGKLREMAKADRSRCELVVVHEDEETGLLLKAKLDQVTDNYVWDWKSTGSDPDGFAGSIGAFMYHCQAAHYLQAAKACGLEVKGFRFACSCKRADKGHVCWVQDIEEPWLVAGLRTRRMLLNLYAKFGNGDNNENQ